MGEFLTIARPYAVALFEGSQEQECQAWEQVLQVLATSVTDTSLLQVVADPKVAASAVQAALLDALTTLIPNPVQCLGVKLHHFLSLILAAQRLNTVPDMLTVFQALIAERARITKVDVSSAFELSPTQLADLQQALSCRWQTHVEVASATVDKKLIGGAVVRARDRDLVFDGSIRNRLNRLSHSLNS